MIAFRNAFEGLWTLDGHLRVVALILLVQLLRDLAQTNVESALLGRVGVERGAYATLLFPLVALGISTVFEGYHWSAYAGIGVALILTGNLLILRRSSN